MEGKSQKEPRKDGRTFNEWSKGLKYTTKNKVFSEMVILRNVIKKTRRCRFRSEDIRKQYNAQKWQQGKKKE